jgi:hypothetical protein
MSSAEEFLDHEWEAPSDFLLDNTNWSPGACGHCSTEARPYERWMNVWTRWCGVHFLAFRHQGQERVAMQTRGENVSDLFDLHEGAERHLRIAGNLPKHLARPLLDENKRLREQVSVLRQQSTDGRPEAREKVTDE